MNDFGLTDTLLNAMKAIISEHNEVTKAVIFGSRAKGNYRKYSDVDIALYGEVDELLAMRIKEAFEELNSPLQFDVLSYNRVDNEDLREHINRCGRLI